MALGKNLNNILGDYFGDSGIENLDLSDSQKPFRQISVQQGSVSVDSNSEIRFIPVDKIVLNPYQTRTQFDFEKIQSLANSIKATGLLSPIIVVQKDDHYVLIAGERRLRAVKLLNQTEILAFVKPDQSLSEEEKVLITATENLQREDLSPIELAYTYKSLMQVLNIDEKGLAERLGTTAQYVKNYLRLLSLCRAVQKALLEKKIGEGHARHLVGLTEEQQEMVLKAILEKDMSVREIIEFVKKINSNTPTAEIQNTPQNHIPSLEPKIIQNINSIAQNLPNSKIKYFGNENKGKVVISWSRK